MPVKTCYIFGHDFKRNANPKNRYYDEYKCTKCNSTIGDYLKENKFRHTFWDSDAWGFVKIVFTALLCMSAVVGFCVLLIGFFSNLTCQQYIKMGIDAKFNLWTGCMANHPKFGWIPIDDYFKTINLYMPK